MTTATQSFGMVPLSFLRESLTNPRLFFDPIPLQELADNIAQLGVGQPILARPIPDSDNLLEIVAGARRFRASGIAGLVEIPAIVREMTDEEVALFQLAENLQRQDVLPLEEAKALDRLKTQFGLSVDAICAKLAIKRSYVYGQLKLLDLDPSVKASLSTGDISPSTALLIARIPVTALHGKAAEEIISNFGRSEPMSYRQAKEHLESRYTLLLERAVFNIADAKLLKGCGSCADCPKMTANDRLLYPDIDSDVCTDPDCFATKTSAHYDRILAVAKKKKLPVFEDDDKFEESPLSETHCSALDRLHNFDRIKPDVGTWKQIEEVLPADALPEPDAYTLNHAGKPVAVFEQGALQAALEKAGIAYTEAEEAERIAAREADSDNDMESTRTKSKYELKNERLAPIAEKESNYRQDLYRQIRDAKPSSLHLLRCIAKVISSETYLEEFLAEQRDYPTDDKELASYIDELDIDAILLLLMDFTVGSSLDVSTYQIDDETEVAEDDEVINDLLKVAAVSGVDATAIRVKHFLTAQAEASPEQADTPKKKTKGKKATAAAAAESAAGDNDGMKELDPKAAWPFPTSKDKA
jgi:ParB/RepB/Spo0J family partition protein